MPASSSGQFDSQHHPPKTLGVVPAEAGTQAERIANSRIGPRAFGNWLFHLGDSGMRWEVAWVPASAGTTRWALQASVGTVAHELTHDPSSARRLSRRLPREKYKLGSRQDAKAPRKKS